MDIEQEARAWLHSRGMLAVDDDGFPRQDDYEGVEATKLITAFHKYMLSKAPPSRDALIEAGDEIELRPAVRWFAEQMEAALRKNDHKGGWTSMTYSRLMSRVDDETRELFLALDRMKTMNGDEDVIKEAADVANFAMMIADNQGPRLGPDAAKSTKEGNA